MIKKRYLQMLNILGFIIFSAGLVKGFLNADLFLSPSVDASIPLLGLCASFVIPMWIIIGLSMFSFCLYQSQGILRKDEREKPSTERVGPLFFIASILNTGWLLARYFKVINISLLILIVLLAVLIKNYLNLEAGARVSSASEILWVKLPFRIYLGWITVITITELAATINLGWEGFGFSEVYWTVAVMAIVIVTAFVFLKRRLDLAASTAMLWFLLGIAIRGFSTEFGETAMAVFALAGMLIIMVSASWFLARKYVSGKIKGA
ncbi:MAG: hypothetical protein GX364_05805 [Firmicutes bacterium]|nr:hypothetical protein [Bacillota bacterium]